MRIIDAIANKVTKILEVFMICIFAMLVIDVLGQVFSRYILSKSFAFTEELARFSLIWLSILGAAYLNAKREHLSMDFLYGKLNNYTKKKVLIFIEVLIFLFALIVMVIGGLNLVYTTLHLEQLSGTLRIPLGYIYAVLPFSGLLIMCFAVYHLSKISSNKILD